MRFKLEDLSNNQQILKSNPMSDNDLQRIEPFFNERNLSLLSSEQIRTINDNLMKTIKKKIVHFRQTQIEDIRNIKNGKEISYECKNSCCWSKRQMIEFYNGEKDRSPRYFDRLSQIDMKLLSDLHYGNLPIPDYIKLNKLTKDILPCLQNNTVIFVDTTDLGEFFKNFHNKIFINYILITGDSDLPCPLHIIDSYYNLLNKIFNGESRILHWFSMNCHLGNNQ